MTSQEQILKSTIVWSTSPQWPHDLVGHLMMQVWWYGATILLMVTCFVHKLLNGASEVRQGHWPVIAFCGWPTSPMHVHWQSIQSFTLRWTRKKLSSQTSFKLIYTPENYTKGYRNTKRSSEILLVFAWEEKNKIVCYTIILSYISHSTVPQHLLCTAYFAINNPIVNISN